MTERLLGERMADADEDEGSGIGTGDVVDLLIQSSRTIDAIGLEGWRIDIGYPEDRDEAEKRLQDSTEHGSQATADD